MKRRLSKNFPHLVYAMLAFFLASVLLLWSWNTLSMLLDGPVAQYKHALAALAFAYILGRVLRSSACRGRRTWLEKPHQGS